MERREKNYPKIGELITSFPEYGIGLHMTSSHRAINILEEKKGIDPSYSFDGDENIFFVLLPNDPHLFEQPISELKGYSNYMLLHGKDIASDDRAHGFPSIPSLVFFEAPEEFKNYREFRVASTGSRVPYETIIGSLVVGTKSTSFTDNQLVSYWKKLLKRVSYWELEKQKILNPLSESQSPNQE